jgi:cellulose synthase/poly-beta-1,6-N-acetylglucosamine synthase-like glycosyltransferase
VILIEILLCILTVALLIPVSVLFVQALSAMPMCRPQAMPGGRRPTVAIVIPAHNEALLIAHTLGSIVPQLAAGDRLLVVADNCTDTTARVATAAGAEVIERSDSEHRGKGYALDFGVRHLRQNPPEIVLIIDGDCEVEVDAIERLARVCLKTGRPVQALYLMHAPPGASVKTRIAEFAWLVKNKVRPLGFYRLGLPCQLMGAGMAFPWSGISTAALATGHIVEDLKLGIEFARAGMPPLYCPDAKVTSNFPTTAQGITDQRKRWEHGHLGMILGVAPRLFAQSVVHGNLPVLALIIDLCVPPLALLMLLIFTVFALSAAFFALTMMALPLGLATVALGISASAVLLAWGRHGRRVISFRDLACTPLYALWKIPLYLKFIANRQSEWIRTKRDAG